MSTDTKTTVDRCATATGDNAWVVLVYENTIQQAFDPAHREEGLRAAAESPLPVDAYLVDGDRVPPPAPGAKVDTEGWTRLAAAATGRP